MQVRINNAIEWLIEKIRLDLHLPNGHQITLPELAWWSVLNEVFEHLPESIAAAALGGEVEVVSGLMKESDILPFDNGVGTALNKKIARAKETFSDEILKKPIKRVDVDPEPALSYMLKPKFLTWESDAYRRWIKTQPCVCCGLQADDPHHIINSGIGSGKMGGKVHDLFTIPLCRQHYNELHTGVGEWEKTHGSQIKFLIMTLGHALGLGGLS